MFTIVNRNNEEKEIISQLREMVGSRAYATEIRSQPKPISGASMRRHAVIKETAKDIKVADDLRDLVNEMKDVSNE